jgi:hypothetical protein
MPVLGGPHPTDGGGAGRPPWLSDAGRRSEGRTFGSTPPAREMPLGRRVATSPNGCLRAICHGRGRSGLGLAMGGR